MDPILALAIVTFVLIIGFLMWNRSSLKKHRETGGGNTTGIGGAKDPMSGTTEGMRHPDEMRAALNTSPAERLANRQRALSEENQG